MTKTILLILFAATILYLPDCKPTASDDSQSPRQTVPLTPTQRHAAVVAQTQVAAVQRAESQLETEHSERLHAEEQTRAAQSSRSHWQTIAFVTGASVLMLVVGIVIGTSTSHENKKK